MSTRITTSTDSENKLDLMVFLMNKKSIPMLINERKKKILTCDLIQLLMSGFFANGKNDAKDPEIPVINISTEIIPATKRYLGEKYLT